MATMYSVKPYCKPNTEIALPNCMYAVDSYHESKSKVTGNETCPSSELDHRQEKILSDIDSLKQDLADIERLLGNTESKKESSPDVHSNKKIKAAEHPRPRLVNEDAVFDIVISASSSCPPLSTFILSKAIKERDQRVSLPSYRHSSFVGDLPSQLIQCGDGRNPLAQGRRGLLFTLVWKSDEFCPSFIVSPLLQTRVTGDANIAKYICSEFLPDLHNYNDVELNAVNNLWIELSLRQLANGNTKEKSAALRSCNAQLGKTKWLTGNDISLADIVFWSAMIDSGAKPEKNANLLRWFKQCCSHPWFTSIADVFA